MEKAPEIFDKGYSMNSVPNSNIVFTGDFSPDGMYIVIERADSFFGDKRLNTPASYPAYQNVFVIPYKPVEVE